MWARVVNVGLGIWLMAAPAVLDYGRPAAANDWIVGPLAASVAIIAISEVTRSVRWANVALGAWLVLAPWVLGYDEGWTILHSTIIGLLMAGLALVRGPIEGRYGGGWRALTGEERGQRMGLSSIVYRLSSILYPLASGL